MRKLARSVALAVVLLAAGCKGANGPGEPGGKFDSDRIVVIISVDGLAGHYLDDPQARMGTIRELAREGVRAESMRASTPTNTWPNHTTLVTGDTPARHGVVANIYFDRDKKKNVQLISDPVYDKDQIIKVPTIYDLAKSAGMRTAAIRWPASRNAKSLNWTFPDVADNDLLHRTTTPELLAECQAAGIWEDGPIQTGQDDPKIKIVSDAMCTRVFLYILRHHHPNLALLHLINVDHTQHLSGPNSPQAYDAIATADEQVGEVWNELQDDYPGRATLIVVSDHGFAPTTHAIFPNIILHRQGLIDVRGIRVVGGSVHTVAQGGADLIYIMDPAHRSQIMTQVRQAFEGMEGIASVAGPDILASYGVADPAFDPHAPDMIVFAEEGYAFDDIASPTTRSFKPTPKNKGGHGHSADLPDLHATFVAWGVGIRPGARLGEISNIDVAPTIARLLGIDMPNVDGKPLEQALAK